MKQTFFKVADNCVLYVNFSRAVSNSEWNSFQGETEDLLCIQCIIEYFIRLSTIKLILVQ